MSEKLLNKRTAEVYTRALNVVITNELGMTPQIRFNLEEAVINPDGTQEGMGFKGQALIGEMTDPNESFLLVNPIDGAPLGGEGTAAQMQTLITSYFYYLTEKIQYEKLSHELVMASAHLSTLQDQLVAKQQELSEEQAANTNPDQIAAIEVEIVDFESQITRAIQDKDAAQTALDEFLLTADHSFGG